MGVKQILGGSKKVGTEIERGHKQPATTPQLQTKYLAVTSSQAF
jgi:hypothetical protein